MAGGVGSGTSSVGRGPGGTGLVPGAVGAGGVGTGIPKPGKSKQQPCFGLASSQNLHAWNTQTQTFFFCVLSRALTLTGYAAGGAGVLPGGGMPANVFTLQPADGSNCYRVLFFVLTQAYITPVELE